MNLSTMRKVWTFLWLSPTLAARLLPFFVLWVDNVVLVAVDTFLALLVAQIDFGPLSVFTALLGLDIHSLLLNLLILSFLLGVLGILAQI